MSRPSRHCLPFQLRLLMLAWLALCLIAQPLLASLGDLHEASHDAGFRVAHVHDTVNHDELTTESSNGDPIPSALHTVLDLSHCCDQSAAAVLPAVATAGSIEIAVTPPHRGSTFVGDARLVSPFRPPITA